MKFTTVAQIVLSITIATLWLVAFGAAVAPLA
jgi:hypothetical protein